MMSEAEIKFIISRVIENANCAAKEAKQNEADELHGYAEYKEAPFAGAKSSTNQAGKTVYKVFNEDIGMSWEEQRCRLRQYRKSYLSKKCFSSSAQM